MRKQLGNLDKAPIQKLEQAATKGMFTIITCIIAVVIVHFAVNFGVDFYNFFEANTESAGFVLYKDNVVVYIKVAFALLALGFIISKN